MPSTPLEPAPRSPTSSCSFAPSARNPRPLSRSVSAQGASPLLARSPPVLRSPLSPRRARCLGEFRLAVSNSGHPLVRPQHLWSVRSALSLFPTQVEIRHLRDSSTSGQPEPPRAMPSHPDPRPEARCPLPHSIFPNSSLILANLVSPVMVVPVCHARAMTS
jgi:hypothetical protein